eukprot:TRINITY_DN92219_c0_g1_i1.p1 TRINITY_DN92219_c0_g1~~TRINITY_DN92219_c0_g1_i1.p1  ORF type:complete len:540 (-),score=98.99 TRINITY_DN92219_c0_g1_i1:132-1697(-)
MSLGSHTTFALPGQSAWLSQGRQQSLGTPLAERPWLTQPLQSAAFEKRRPVPWLKPVAQPAWRLAGRKAVAGIQKRGSEDAALPAEEGPGIRGAALTTLMILLAISSLNHVGITTLAPISGGLMKHFDLKSDAGLGIIVSSFAVGRLLTTSIWPILSDFVGRKKILIIALLGGCLGALLQGTALVLHWSFVSFLIARGVSGMFSGIVPVIKAYIGDRFAAEDIPKIMAYREAAITIAYVVGPLIGGLLASWTFSAPLFFCASATLLAAFLAAVGLQAPKAKGKSSAVKKKKKSSIDDGTPKAKSGQLLPLLLLSFTWASARTCFRSYCPLIMTRTYSMSVTEVGSALTAASLLAAVVQIFGFDPVCKRLGLKETAIAGAALISGVMALLAFGQGFTTLPVFLGAYAVFGIGVALLSPALPAILVRVAPKDRLGALLGLDSVLQNFGRIVGPPLFGLCKFERSIGWAAAAMTAATAATSVTLVSLKRPDAVVEAEAEGSSPDSDAAEDEAEAVPKKAKRDNR